MKRDWWMAEKTSALAATFGDVSAVPHGRRRGLSQVVFWPPSICCGTPTYSAPHTIHPK